MKKHFKIYTKENPINYYKEPVKPPPTAAPAVLKPDSWRLIEPELCELACVKKIICHPHAIACLEKQGGAIYIKEEDNLVYIAIKSDFDKSPHPMLEVSEFAYFRDGFWVVAYSKGAGQYEVLSHLIRLP